MTQVNIMTFAVNEPTKMDVALANLTYEEGASIVATANGEPILMAMNMGDAYALALNDGDTPRFIYGTQAIQTEDFTIEQGYQNLVGSKQDAYMFTTGAKVDIQFIVDGWNGVLIGTRDRIG